MLNVTSGSASPTLFSTILVLSVSWFTSNDRVVTALYSSPYVHLSFQLQGRDHHGSILAVVMKQVLAFLCAPIGRCLFVSKVGASLLHICVAT